MQSTFYFTDDAKGFDCVDQKQTVENSERDENTRPVSWGTRVQVRRQEGDKNYGKKKRTRQRGWACHSVGGMVAELNRMIHYI